MTQDERLIELENLVHLQGKVTLDYICNQYKISYDSARRDLVKLTKLPNIARIRGGAILDNKREHISYDTRFKENNINNILIKTANEMINENDIIFIDSGTTLTALAQHLNTTSNVITNSTDVLNALVGKENIRKTILGGTFDEFSHTILGNSAIEQIKKFKADKAFIGVSALSDAGLTTNTELDALIKLEMAKCAKKMICIAHHSKFNTQLMYQSCSWADIDVIITDIVPPLNICKLIETNDVDLIVIND